MDRLAGCLAVLLQMTHMVPQCVAYKQPQIVITQAGQLRHLLQQAQNFTGIEAATQCIMQHGDLYSQYVRSCNSSGGSGPRDLITGLLQKCLSSSTAQQPPIRLLGPGGVYMNIILNLTSSYSHATGIPIVVNALSIFTVTKARLASIANAANMSLTHEAWVGSVTGIGDGVKLGVFKDLSSLLGLDNRLQWQGMLPNVRTSGVSYKNEVIGIPISAYTFHLVYRKDLFQQYNLTANFTTWEEFADFTQKINGTGGRHAFCGLFGPCWTMGTMFMRYMMATMTQTHGSTQGWLYEPDSMKLLLDSAAMAEALRLTKALYDISPPDDSMQYGCPVMQHLLNTDHCLMSIVHPSVFKAASHISHKDTPTGFLYGKLGFARWPGSRQVLDVPTNTLVPCDAQRCPYATQYTNPDGSTYLVNESPGFEANLFSVNNKQPADRAFYTTSVLSYLASPEASDILAFTTDSEMLPTRTAQLDVQRWVQAGYQPTDAAGYCNDTRHALDHPNMNIQARMPGATNVVYLLFVAASNMLFAGTPIPEVLQVLQTNATALIAAQFANALDFKEEYWASLNRFTVQPPSLHSSDGLIAPDNSGSNKKQTMIMVVVLPVCGAGLLIAFVYWYWKHGNKSQTGRVRHPGAGPLTTLLVTDIENSTNLWESLDASVMDASVKLHNACMRTLAAKHQGYESIWEGDSFIIAFPSPHLALNFAVACQQELLTLPWPSKLLQSYYAEEVYLKPSKHQAGLDKKMSASAVNASSINGSRAGGQSFSGGPPRSPSVIGIKLASGLASLAAPPSPKGAARPAGLISTAFDDASDVPDNQTCSDGTSSAGDILRPDLSPIAKSPNAPAMPVSRYFSSLWRGCSKDTPGAVVAYRGLRIRMGLHAGVPNAADIRFNNAMRRWHYTGALRAISNAVASAGHGGHIMMSSTTAALLDMDGVGRLQALPSDCLAYYMGLHKLNRLEEPTDLLLVLPYALRCRMAVTQDALRSLQVILPGVLDSPLPTAGITLTCVELSSLDALLRFSKAEAYKAISCTLGCLQGCIAECGGLLSEDGLSMILASGKAKSSRLVGSSYPDLVTPGRIVVAFTDADAALKCALSFRHQMLHLDWSDDLLAHELWERVGSAPVEPNNNWMTNPTFTGEAIKAVEMPVPKGLVRMPSGYLNEDGSYSEDTRSERSKGRSRGVASKSSMGESGLSSVLTAGMASGKTDPKSHKSAKLLAANGGLCVLESQYLRGLRSKTIVLSSSKLNMEFATRSSGRIVYVGKIAKLIEKLLRKMKAGQILASPQLVNSHNGN